MLVCTALVIRARVGLIGGGGGGEGGLPVFKTSITILNLQLGYGKESLIPHSNSFFFSRESTLFPERWSSAIPTIVFFSNSSLIHAQIFSNPAPQVAVKSRIPLTFSESRTVFWSNRGTREYPSRPCAIKPPKQNPGSIPFLFRW